MLIALFALAVAVWGAVFLLKGSPVWGCLAFLLTACCFGHPFFNFDLGPIPLTLDRLVFLFLLLTAVVRWKLGKMDPKPLAWPEKLTLAFAALLTVSMFLTDWRYTLKGEVPPVVRLALGYLMPITVYFIARQSALTQRTMTALVAVLAGLGAYLAITGILEAHEQWSLVFPTYIANPELGIHYGRARGPMLTSVTYGLFLSTCLAATWVLLPRLPRWGQLLVAALTPLFLAGLYFSYTRSVWMGAGLAGVLVLGMLLRGAWRNVVVAGLICGGGLFTVTRLDSILNFKREGTIADTRESADMRKSFAYVSWKMFWDRPLFGVGFGQFPTAKLPYLDDPNTELRLQSIRRYVHHNTFLGLLTENGLIGMGLFLTILAGWVVNIRALWKSPQAPPWARYHAVLLLAAMAAYVCQLGAHELSYSTLDNSLLFLLAGIASGLRHQFAPAAKQDPLSAILDKFKRRLTAGLTTNAAGASQHLPRQR
jgi:O-antigen ligase